MEDYKITEASYFELSAESDLLKKREEIVGAKLCELKIKLSHLATAINAIKNLETGKEQSNASGQ